jgi:hypothetical protein
MKTFKQFLTESEVITTARSNMIHLQKMKDVEFISFIKKIKTQFDGKLQGLKVSLKVDGGGGRFGLSKTGEPFFEGSRTGPITQPKSFSKFAISKGAEGISLERAHHYDSMFDIVTGSKFIKALPKDSKVICELFYNPMGELSDDGIKFVSIKYDKSKLGKTMTIIPFNVLVASTGEAHPDSDKIIQDLLSASTDDIKFIDIKLQTSGAIDISAMVDPIMSMNQTTLELLGSRLKKDAEEKQSIKAILQGVKDQVAQYILDHPAIVGKFKLGPDIEGLVLDLDGSTYKVTTTEFKATKVK